MPEIIEHKVKKSMCPNCGYLVDAAQNADHERRAPRVNDFSLCFGCCALLRFREGMTMAIATADEIIRDLPPEDQRMIQMIRFMWRKVFPNGRKNDWSEGES